MSFKKYLPLFAVATLMLSSASYPGSSGAIADSSSAWFYRCNERMSRETDEVLDGQIESKKFDVKLKQTNLNMALIGGDRNQISVAIHILNKAQSKLQTLYELRQTPRVEVYEWLFIGKELNVTTQGICLGWSRFSDYCSYTTDHSGNELFCKRENVGAILKTP